MSDPNSYSARQRRIEIMTAFYNFMNDNCLCMTIDDGDVCFTGSDELVGELVHVHIRCGTKLPTED